ncbi:MAG: 4-hydroxythreonine-4-phosphate dehydrogenase PdxA [Ignavibacteriales bacterium CG07_land_8_20_14_0_80_59_12]|nr:MAG: 4-hydroxythreonine-4-phosphate dehydrogenase PdxA [Ignavibacteriales bacterium CG07_land_8_20_14_0_80_59_12]
MKPIIAITVGDFNGIGPEVALKAVTSSMVRRIAEPLLIGPRSIFEFTARTLGLLDSLSFADADLRSPIRAQRSSVPIVDLPGYSEKDVRLGKVSSQAGRCAGEAIERAVQLCLNGPADAVVTAPISKEALHKGGFQFDGHTEFLAALTHTANPLMLFLSPSMRVALVTIHRPLREVAPLITGQHLTRVAQIFAKSLQSDFGIVKPRIAVLGLNPHAGEHGEIGEEEETVILPTIAMLRRKGINVAGPFSADTFFGTKAYAEADGVLAMYHDQGLIPVKLLHFHEAVNFTAGLPIVRTSPDHGTAFGLAGKGIANPGSMIAAVRAAVEIKHMRNG